MSAQISHGSQNLFTTSTIYALGLTAISSAMGITLGSLGGLGILSTMTVGACAISFSAVNILATYIESEPKTYVRSVVCVSLVCMAIITLVIGALGVAGMIPGSAIGWTWLATGGHSFITIALSGLFSDTAFEPIC